MASPDRNPQPAPPELSPEGKLHQAEAGYESLEDILKEFDAAAQGYQAVADKWGGQIDSLRLQLNELRSGIEASEVDRADEILTTMEALRAEVETVLVPYRAEMRLESLKKHYEGQPGAEFLDKEKIKATHGEAVEILLKHYAEKGSKFSIRGFLGRDKKDFESLVQNPEIQAMMQELGLSEADLPQLAQTAELEAGRQLAAKTAEVPQSEKQKRFFSKIGKSVAINIGAGMAASATATAIVGTGGAGFFAAAGLMAGWRGVNKYFATAGAKKNAWQEVQAGLESPNDATKQATNEVYQGAILDVLQVNQLERLREKAGEQTGDAYEMARQEYVASPGTPADKDKLRARLTKLREEVESFPGAALIPMVKEQLAALQCLEMTNSGLDLEREMAAKKADLEAKKNKKTTLKDVGVEGAKIFGYTLAGRAANQLPVIGQIIAGAGGWKIGEAYVREIHGDDESYVKNGKLTKKAYGVMAAGALGMGVFSIAAGGGHELKEFYGDWQQAGLGAAAAGAGSDILESLGLDQARPAEAKAAPGGPPPVADPLPEVNPRPTADQASLAATGQPSPEDLAGSKGYTPPVEAAPAPAPALARAAESGKTWQDTIETPAGASSHDSIWASTRSLLKAHATELGVDKQGAELDKWAETQTANLVKQLGVEQGGRVEDLVHNGDQVILEKGADNTLRLRFEATSGIEAGFLPEHPAAVEPVPPSALKAASAEDSPEHSGESGAIPGSRHDFTPLEATPAATTNLMDRPGAAMSPADKTIAQAMEIYRGHLPPEIVGVQAKAAHESAVQDLVELAENKPEYLAYADVRQAVGGAAGEALDNEVRQGLGILSFGSPNPEKLFTYASAFGQAHNLSETEARLYAAWLGGPDGVLQRDDFKPLLGVAGEGKNHLDLAAVAKTVETFREAANIHEAPKGGAWQPRLVYIDEKNTQLVNFRETAKGFVYDFNADGQPDKLDGQVAYLDKEKVAALLAPAVPEAPLPEATVEEAPAPEPTVEQAPVQTPAPPESPASRQVEPAPAPKTMPAAEAGFGDMVNTENAIQAFKDPALSYDEKMAALKWVMADGERMKFGSFDFARSGDRIMVVTGEGADGKTTGYELTKDNIGRFFESHYQAEQKAYDALQAEATPEPAPEAATKVEAVSAPEAAPAPAVEVLALEKTPAESIAETFLLKVAADKKVEINLADGINSDSELKFLREIYAETIQQAVNGDVASKEFLGVLNSLIDKYAVQNKDFFTGQHITSHEDIFPAMFLDSRGEIPQSLR